MLLFYPSLQGLRTFNLRSFIVSTGRQKTLAKTNPLASSNSFHNTSIAATIFRARDIVIPLDKVDFQFARSSGPGGQNVNKLNTKAEIRFNLTSADWIPEEVKQRLRAAQSNKISKNGEVIISSQEHRTQTKNKEDCITKLQEMLAEAYVEPKERTIWEGLGEKGKAMRVQERKKRSAVKDFRRQKNFDFDD
eukprot:gene28242-37155_t